MKVLQALTWVGPGNPFGGPLRVAVNQAAALRERGHEVDIVAAQPRRRNGWTADSLGVHAHDAWRVLPGAGFSGVVSPSLLNTAWRTIRSYDVVHLHLARDFVTLPIAAMCRLRGVPYVVQPHGMVDASKRPLARLLDATLTRRVMRDASNVFVLTPIEEADVRDAFGDHLRFERLLNGVPVPPDVPGLPERTEVLFCSRLHRRKHPVTFTRAAAELIAAGTDATFTLVGSDEGELAEIREVAASAGQPPQLRIEPALEPDQVLERLGRSSILALPSVDEPFPMVVLESLSLARPVIVSDSCGLAPFVAEHDCGVVIPGGDQQALVEAISRLLADPRAREEMGARGRAAVIAELGMPAIAAQLESAYARAVDRA